MLMREKHINFINYDFWILNKIEHLQVSLYYLFILKENDSINDILIMPGTSTRSFKDIICLW